ncbi:MAG TPA: ParB/RepB/Spo0J family partition protein [Syntrophomonadaceae bacterium]|nr:ParB/RepB/Spo0J family partition protein [Syntrophomonadaceae bacterium]
MPKKERGLGRGLDALFTNNNETISELDITLIKPRNDQPRKKFNEESLSELAESINQHGVLQPLLVRPRGGKYEIVAGERRWRAAKIAGLSTINVIIKNINNQEAAEISLIENLQRDDLSVMEEAQAYKNMMEKHAFTQEMIADRIGRSRSYIANVMRILNLPSDIISLIEEQKISASHARTLLALPTDEERIAAALEIIEGKMSVRQIEKSVRVSRKLNGIQKKSIEISEIEIQMQKYFGTKAEIITRKKGGKIEITYYSDEELERILDLFRMN